MGVNSNGAGESDEAVEDREDSEFEEVREAGCVQMGHLGEGMDKQTADVLILDEFLAHQAVIVGLPLKGRKELREELLAGGLVEGAGVDRQKEVGYALAEEALEFVHVAVILEQADDEAVLVDLVPAAGDEEEGGGIAQDYALQQVAVLHLAQEAQGLFLTRLLANDA